MRDDHHTADSARAEALVQLFDSVLTVRRRYQFFVWLQNHVQSVLPHEIAVCGAYQRNHRRLGYEVFNSVVLSPEATGLLCDPGSALLRSATTAWVRARAQPVVVAVAAVAAEHGEASVQALVAAGIVEVLAHGVARPQRASELESFFLLASTSGRITQQQARGVELLMPYLHSTYLRVRATEEEVGRHGHVSLPVSNSDFTLTDRERQVLTHVREGLSNQQIGVAMGISPLTVKNHVQRLLRKLGATNRAQAVAKTSNGVVEMQSGDGRSLSC